MGADSQPAWWDETYDEVISPLLFSDAREGLPTPHALLIGGQPGAGKSKAIAALRPELAVDIIGDDLRPFHPDYEQLMAADHLAMPDATAAASGYWVGRALRGQVDTISHYDQPIILDHVPHPDEGVPA